MNPYLPSPDIGDDLQSLPPSITITEVLVEGKLPDADAFLDSVSSWQDDDTRLHHANAMFRGGSNAHLTVTPTDYIQLRVPNDRVPSAVQRILDHAYFTGCGADALAKSLEIEAITAGVDLSPSIVPKLERAFEADPVASETNRRRIDARYSIVVLPSGRVEFPDYDSVSAIKGAYDRIKQIQ